MINPAAPLAKRVRSGCQGDSSADCDAGNDRHPFSKARLPSISRVGTVFCRRTGRVGQCRAEQSRADSRHFPVWRSPPPIARPAAHLGFIRWPGWDDPTNHRSVAHGTRIVKYSVVCSRLRCRRVKTARGGSSPEPAAPSSQSCWVNASFLKLAVADAPSGPTMHHPRRLHSAKTTRVDHLVCRARAAI